MRLGSIEIRNKFNRKRYVISTVEGKRSAVGRYQTAVFTQRFGFLAGFFRPVFATANARGEDEARLQHSRVEGIVRDIDPRDSYATGWVVALATQETDEESAEFEGALTQIREILGGGKS
jgi:hypothetical protein